MKYLTRRKFVEQVTALKSINPDHWGNEARMPGQPVALERWSYHQKTIEILKSLDPANVLEAGTMGIQVAEESDTIDLDMPEWGWRLTYSPTYNHDLRLITWPIKTKSYEVFVALRVFHHLDNEAACLTEMERIAHHIILAQPEDSARRYEAIRQPDHRYHFDDTDTTILVYHNHD
jgi:hypothetical protein